MKKLWIDPRLIAYAVKDKVVLDALALCVLVKLKFVSSRVKDATTRRMMQLFHVSYGRCVKAIEAGVKEGWLIKEGKDIRAARIRVEKGCEICLTLPTDTRLTLSQVCNILRSALTYNHISKLDDLRDTIQLAYDPKPGELQKCKRARQRLAKHGMPDNESTLRKYLRLSYRKAADILNMSVTTAKNIIRRLRKAGLIERIMQFEETAFTVEQFSKRLQNDYAKYGKRGFIVLSNGMVCLQLANSYTIAGQPKVKFQY